MDINEYKNNGGKVFLYAPKYPASEAATEKIIREWQKKTFGVTNVILVVYVKETVDWYRYAARLVQRSWGCCAPVTYVAGIYAKITDWLAKADFYVVDSMEESLDNINIVVSHGGTILSIVSEDEAFPVFQYTEGQKKTLSGYQKIIDDELFSKYSPREYEYILFHNGLGETVAFYYLMAEYKAKNNKPIVVLCYDESRKSLLEESPYIDVVAHVPFPLYEYIAVFLADQYSMKYFLEFYYKRNIVDSMIAVDTDRGYWQQTRLCAGLSGDGPVQKYATPVSEAKRKVGQEIFRKWNLREGRTVWLCMDGLSNGTLYASDFFKKLVAAIREADYDVIVKSDKSVIEGLAFAQLYPWETTELVSLCGNIISIPTGITYAVKAMNMDRPLNIQMLFFEEMYMATNPAGQFLVKCPMMRKYGHAFYNHVAAEEFDEGLHGDNIKIKKISIYRNTEWETLIPSLVNGLD